MSFVFRRHLFVVGKLNPNVSGNVIDWGPVKLEENPANLKDNVDGYLTRIERELLFIGIYDA